MYYHASFWPEGVISLVINVLVWALIISFFVFLIRKMSGRHGGCCGEEEKNDSFYLDIIKKRYAKGEINKKEYEELKKDFSGESEEQPVETDKSEK